MLLKVLSSFLEPLLNPVDPDTRACLEEKWRQLPTELQSVRQIYGRHEEGCGATCGCHAEVRLCLSRLLWRLPGQAADPGDRLRRPFPDNYFSVLVFSGTARRK